MIVKRVKEGLAWRYRSITRRAARKRYLRRTFANGEALASSYLNGTPCDEAVCRDGMVIRHPPGRSALAQMLLEVWFDEVYTGAFYSPQPGDTVVDAGANIGLFSLLIGRRQPRLESWHSNRLRKTISYSARTSRRPVSPTSQRSRQRCRAPVERLR